MVGKKKSASNAEKMKEWRFKKAEKNRAKHKAYYEKNRERKIKEVQERVRRKQPRHVRRHATQLAVHRKERQQDKISASEKREKIRQKTRERVRRFREKQRQENRSIEIFASCYTNVHGDCATSHCDYNCFTVLLQSHSHHSIKCNVDFRNIIGLCGSGTT